MDSGARSMDFCAWGKFGGSIFVNIRSGFVTWSQILLIYTRVPCAATDVPHFFTNCYDFFFANILSVFVTWSQLLLIYA